MQGGIQGYFDEFIEEISIGEPQTSRMESAANTIVDFLMTQYNVPAAYFFLQGSYPNGTAVEPVDGGEYDVDLAAVCVDDHTSSNKALDDLEAAFQSDGRFSSRIVLKKPCVRLEYAPDDVGKFHVDIVPARESLEAPAPLEAPRRNEGWHGTAPQEYTAWCKARGIHYALTVKALKRWRDNEQSVRTAVKSIVLQVLTAQHMPADVTDDGRRLAETLLVMNASLSPLESAPAVINPVLPDEDLAARWSDESFKSFQRELTEAAEIAELALNASDTEEAVDAWRDLLGEDFPTVRPSSLGLTLGDTSHEAGPDAKGWRVNLDDRYSIRIDAQTQRGNRAKSRKPYSSTAQAIYAGRKIRFKAKVQGPGGGKIWWQVTNTGGHAAQDNSLRGDFLEAKGIDDKPSRDPSEHWENTAYTGTHRVRALIVKENVVVARSPFMNVNIFSGKWRR